MKKKSRLRILGNDRFIMMLCKDARRRWLQYGENRKTAQKEGICEVCKKLPAEEWDHIVPLGPRPRVFADFPSYLQRLVEEKCQGLCKTCHLAKTKKEREAKKCKSA